MPPKDKYTDPKLRDEVKEEIHEGDKGGAPGQWSARKAQMMASEYKKRGGGYTTDKKDQDESQEHLSKWGEEDWQTKDGSGNAKQADGTEKRYLPKKAWEQMSEEEKKATDDKKQKESAEGKQHVSNTSKAKESRKNANDEEDKKHAQKKEEEKDGEKEEDDEQKPEEQDEEKEDKENDEDAHAGQKRTRSSTSPSASKKQKQNSGETASKSNDNSSESKKSSGDKESNGDDSASKKDDQPSGKPGSASRLPSKGQTVTWKSLPGWVEGSVMEIACEEKEVEGKKVKASKEDPRVVLKTSSSGKVAVHKPEAVYF